MRKIAALSVIVILGTLMLPGCRTAPAIKIGLIAEISGNIPAVGRSAQAGAALAVKEINARGGIEIAGQKHKLQLIVEDSAADPATAVSMAKKLIDDDGVLAIVGPNASRNAVAAAETADEAGVLLVAPWSTDPQTTIGKETVYRACFTDEFEMAALAGFARGNLGADKAAVIYDEENPVLQKQAELFKSAFLANRGVVVPLEAFKTGDTDFGAQLGRIRAASPDILFIPAYYEDVAALVTQARRQGIETTIIGSDAWVTPELIAACGAACEGAYVANHYSADAPNESTRAFVEAYKAEYGNTPDDVAALNYDSFGLLATALANSAGLDRSDVLDGMAAVSECSGATGLMRFENGAHEPTKGSVILRIQDGRFQWVVDVNPTPSAAEVERFVEDAVAYAQANGKEKALAAFNSKEGPFQRGELYIYAYDFDGNVLAHGGDIAFVGQNLLDMVDPNGVKVIQELRDRASSGSG